MLVLDTYALVEIKKGNPKFAHIMNKAFVIPDPVIAEFYILLMKEDGEEEARFWYKKLSFYCRPVNADLFIKSLKFREANKKQNISIFDAVGYIFAMENNLKFLTGDKAFEHKEGVEFIKK